ncbi:MAG: hypothetical protein R8N24_01660 [Alphaproteobacteria bacterium]|nr:hypothetical protein [Alphaproteobacteria bacterium]
MTPEQLNWTDEQWAIHMGCPVQDVPSIRTHANNEVIPKLELSKFWSNALYIPQRALQMLHVQER